MTPSDLRNNSYVPYSRRPKIAIAESANGYYYPGVRIENISYPLTISAVQNALFCCLSEEEEPTTLFIESPTNQQELDYWLSNFNIDTAPIENLADFDPAAIWLPKEDIPMQLQGLLDRAVVPESEFPVAAIVTTDAGNIGGVNIETPDWSRGLCAERVALAKSITYGCKRYKALYIHTSEGEYSSPCGACRQVMAEHMPRQPVHLYHADHSHSVHRVSELLPYNFQSSILGKESKNQL